MEQGVQTGKESWSMVKTLGQGSYGSVTLWKNNKSGQSFGMLSVFLISMSTHVKCGMTII